MSMVKKVLTLKTQRNAENSCGNRMWQLGFNDIVHGRHYFIGKTDQADIFFRRQLFKLHAQEF